MRRSYRFSTRKAQFYGQKAKTKQKSRTKIITLGCVNKYSIQNAKKKTKELNELERVKEWKNRKYTKNNK